MMKIAIDVGGTYVRVCAFTRNPESRMVGLHQFSRTDSYRQDIVNIANAIGATKAKPIEAIGMALAGVIGEHGVVVSAPNLKHWRGQHPARDLRRAFGCPVTIENDTAAEALAQLRQGGAGNHFIMLVWGSGIGGAEVRLVNGAELIEPFEPGHQQFDFTDRACGCGQRGCWELTCGGKGIRTSYGKRAGDLDESEWERVITQFCRGLANLLAVRPADTVAFSGGVSFHRPDIVERIGRELPRYLCIVPAPRRIFVSPLGEHIGLYGARELLS